MKGETGTIQQAVQALEEGKQVYYQVGTRYLRVNAITQAADGHWVMKWSHPDYYHAQDGDLDDDDTFLIRGQYTRFLRQKEKE